MTRLGIDARLINQTGVGVYIKNLIFWSKKYLPKEWRIYLYVLPGGSPDLNLPGNQFIVREVNYRWHGVSEQTLFLSAINKDKLDLMHFTYFSYPIFYSRPFISTVHDLTHILYKSGKASTRNKLIYGAKAWGAQKILETQIKRAKAIITPTIAVKNEIKKYFGEKYSSKIVHIYEGVDENLKGEEENNSLGKIYKKPFLIYVGNFYPHKNVENLIKAFAQITKDAQLILIGPDDFFSRRITMVVKSLKQFDRILFYKNARSSDLVFFYKNALGLVNPSLAEGFGLTNIEALYFGCPVTASDIPVFKEVLGASFLPFNPNDPVDIAQKINTLLAGKGKQDTQKIQKKYSFETMTIQTVSLYQKVLND